MARGLRRACGTWRAAGGHALPAGCVDRRARLRHGRHRTYDVRTPQAGERFWRAEAAQAAEHPGRFLGHEPALTKGGAEALYNAKKWGNPLDTLREYRLRHDVTVYHGKVAGGTGRQTPIPRTSPTSTSTSSCTSCTSAS